MSSSLIPPWKQILRQNFTSWEKLAQFLELDSAQREFILKNPAFTLNLPLRLAQKIKKASLDDPILHQFLPTNREKVESAGFMKDPVGDHEARCTDKLLNKYQGRVLIIASGACAMHCRFCFRQNFDYMTQEKTFEKEIDYVANDPTIHEVILSGGDPLSLSDYILKNLIHKLSQIKHVNRIRFHTRFPIGIPERLDDSFLKIFDGLRQSIWFVIHSNHPVELDEDVLSHLKALQRRGVILLNHTVLLKGVNDNIATMKALCEKLVDNGIAPYYLHQLDKVQGAAHFEVNETEGEKLIKALSEQLPGYAVPKYVREVSGQPSKIEVSSIHNR